MTEKVARPYEVIGNHELVLDIFGRWPTFHDGEIYRLVLDRTRRRSDGSYYPSIELLVRGWNLTSEVTVAGLYKQENDSLVHILFEEVSDVELDGLNHQNVVSGIEVELVPVSAQADVQQLAIVLEHCYGLSGSFKAAKAQVLSVVPYA